MAGKYRRLLARLEGLPPWAIIAAAYVTILVLGLVDELTGHELGLSIFYLAPLLAVTWYVSFPQGAVTAVAAGLMWGVMDLGSGDVYSNALIPVWNTGMRIAFFLVAAYLLSRLRDSTERERELSRTDPLTGVANTRAFHERAVLEIERARRTREPLTFAYIDLDQFKYVNDTFGHSVGDEVLRRTASALSEGVRTVDVVARLGGDEFGVLMPGADVQSAGRALERLTEALGSGIHVGDASVTWTIGAAAFETPPCTIDDMIHLADELMYEGKRTGRNQVVLRRAHGQTTCLRIAEEDGRPLGERASM